MGLLIVKGPFTVRLPDGTEYGPADLPTLAEWRREGRLLEGTLVWPEGSPEWLAVSAVLPEETVALHIPFPQSPVPAAAAPPRPARASAPVSAPVPKAAPRTEPVVPPTPEPVVTDAPPGTVPVRPPRLRPARPAPAAKVPRAVLLSAAGFLMVAVLLGALYVALSPWIAKRRALAEIQRQSLPDRRFADLELGVTVDVPQGWIILRPDTRLVPPSDAKLVLAQPTLPAYAILRVDARPRLVAADDLYLDALVETWRIFRPGLKELRRSTERLAKGQARLLQATWDDGGELTAGSILVFHDGWNYFSLQAWTAATHAEAFAPEFQALARGIAPDGDLEGRVDDAVRQVELEAPELSRSAIRLLVQARMSTGARTADLPETSLRVVTQGLRALSPAEAQEMGLIYVQVWGPLPEDERKQLAHYLENVKAGRPVAAEEAQPLRQLVKAGIISLPEEQRARLQALNEKAIVAGLAAP